MANEVPSQTPTPSTNKVLWIVALVVVVALAALLFVYLFHSNVQAPAVVTQPPAPKLKVDKHDLAPSQVPDQFPSELLALEKGAKLTQNYNASAADGRFQATRAYETNKSLADAIKVYTDFFNKNGWKIVNTLNQDMLKVVIATKNTVQVLVVADENSKTHVHAVTVTATQVSAPASAPVKTPANTPTSPGY